MNEFSYNEMRTWERFKITFYCICDWYESGELGGRRSSRFPVVETRWKPWVAKHQQRSSSAKTVNGPNTSKSSITGLWSDFKCWSDQRCCKCRLWVEYKCMEFVAAGWCTGKWLRLLSNVSLCNGSMAKKEDALERGNNIHLQQWPQIMWRWDTRLVLHGVDGEKIKQDRCITITEYNTN